MREVTKIALEGVIVVACTIILLAVSRVAGNDPDPITIALLVVLLGRAAPTRSP